MIVIASPAHACTCGVPRDGRSIEPPVAFEGVALHPVLVDGRPAWFFEIETVVRGEITGDRAELRVNTGPGTACGFGRLSEGAKYRVEGVIAAGDGGRLQLGSTCGAELTKLAPSPGEGRVHIVTGGQWLWKIAREHLRAHSTDDAPAAVRKHVQEVVELNRAAIGRSPNRLRVGTELKLPVPTRRFCSTRAPKGVAVSCSAPAGA